MTRLKMNPKIRYELILNAALAICSEPGGWNTLTIQKVAQQAHCTSGLVYHYFGSIDSLRRKLVKVSIKRENFDVLIQALTSAHPEALKMNRLLQQLVFAHMLKPGV